MWLFFYLTDLKWSVLKYLSRACWTFDRGTDRDYFLDDLQIKIVSIVILYVSFYQ